MGRTQKPLNLLVHPELYNTPEVQELVAKGHFVVTDHESAPGSVWDYDAILGKTAWRMTLRHIQYLPLAVKEARDHKYPARKGEEL